MDSKPKDKKPRKGDRGKRRKKYDFGTVRKIALQTSEVDLSAFARMDIFPGDGCDPSKVLSDYTHGSC
jgi:hypothetical protein